MCAAREGGLCLLTAWSTLLVFPKCTRLRTTLSMSHLSVLLQRVLSVPTEPSGGEPATAIAVAQYLLT